MRRLLGAIVGLLLFFPGAEVLKWLAAELGLYQDMTLTDALLAIIIILASVLMFGQARRALTAEELDRQAKAMELASRRLERAQRLHEQARRGRRTSSRGAAAEPSPSSRRRSSSRRRTRDEDDRRRR